MPKFNDEIIAEFRTNKGHVGRRFGSSLVLIHTVGQSSGKRRVNPAMSLRDGDDWLVVGSAMGAPSDPAWVKNLRAHPQSTVEVPALQVGGADIEHVKVTAEELSGVERDQAFARFAAKSDSFSDTRRERVGYFRSSDCADHPCSDLLRGGTSDASRESSQI